MNTNGLLKVICEFTQYFERIRKCLGHCQIKWISLILQRDGYTTQTDLFPVPCYNFPSCWVPALWLSSSCNIYAWQLFSSEVHWWKTRLHFRFGTTRLSFSLFIQAGQEWREWSVTSVWALVPGKGGCLMGCRTAVPRRRWQMDPFLSLLLCAALTLAQSLKCILSHIKLQKLVEEEGCREGIGGMRKRWDSHKVEKDNILLVINIFPWFYVT